VRGLLLEREVAELVDDEQLGLRVERDLVRELALELRPRELCEERCRGHEQHRMAGLDGGAAERDCQVRLTNAGRPEHEHVFGAGDEAAGRELAHELGIDRRLELELELLERLHRWEVRDLDPHRDALLLLGLGLLGEHLIKKVEVCGLGACGLRQDAVEALRHGTEPELEQPLLDASTDDVAHEAPPAASA
jgi:hypothetical protein